MASEQDNTSQGQVERKVSFISNRGLRQVPLNWEHPKDERGRFKPLFDHSHFSEDLLEEYNEDMPEGEKYTGEQILGWHMPDFSDVPQERMGICAYEDTSEGTPISPVFPNTPEGRFQIAKYCAENQTVFASQTADIETWAAMLFGRNTALVDMETGRVEISDSSQRQ